MSCPELLPELRDHAAGAEPTQRLAAHLRACTGCAAALDAERRVLGEVDEVLAALARTEPSPAFLAGARALADRPGANRWRLPGLSAAAALLLAGLSAAVLQRLEWEDTPAGRPSPIGSPAPSRDTFPAVAPPLPKTARAVSPPTSVATQRPVLQAVAIVPPGQEALLRHYATLIENGVVDSPPRIPEPDEPDAPLHEPTALFLPPLTIAPIEADEAPSED